MSGPVVREKVQALVLLPCFTHFLSHGRHGRHTYLQLSIVTLPRASSYEERGVSR